MGEADMMFVEQPRNKTVRVYKVKHWLAISSILL